MSNLSRSRKLVGVGLLFSAGSLFVMLVVASVGCGGNGLPENGVARVGSVVITKTQLDAGVKEIQSENTGQVPTPEQAAAFQTFQSQVLDYMVTLEVVTQEASALKVAVTDAEVQAQIDALKAQFGGDETLFQQAMTQQGLTLDAMTANLRSRLLLQKAFTAVTQGVTVPDSALQAYYDQNKANFTVGETRRIRHILITPQTASAAGNQGTTTAIQPTQAEWDAALALAQKLRQASCPRRRLCELGQAVLRRPRHQSPGGRPG